MVAGFWNKLGATDGRPSHGRGADDTKLAVGWRSSGGAPAELGAHVGGAPAGQWCDQSVACRAHLWVQGISVL